MAPKLQREVVVGSALRLLNEVGMDGLTTRRLAQELGVQSPALYWHFRSKRDLLDAVADAMLQGADLHGAMRPGVPWQEWLAENARRFRRALLAYRDGARVHAGTRPGPDLLPAAEAQVRALCDVGFTPATAAGASLAIGRFALAWVLEEQAENADAPERDGAPPNAAFMGQPLLSEAVREFDAAGPDAAFEFGLRLIISGLEAELTRGPRFP